jgi:hypothetical protein
MTDSLLTVVKVPRDPGLLEVERRAAARQADALDVLTPAAREVLEQAEAEFERRILFGA